MPSLEKLRESRVDYLEKMRRAQKKTREAERRLAAKLDALRKEAAEGIVCAIKEIVDGGAEEVKLEELRTVTKAKLGESSEALPFVDEMLTSKGAATSPVGLSGSHLGAQGLNVAAQ